MARVRLVHWNGPEGRECRLRLASLGYEAEFDLMERTSMLRAFRARPPDAFVIDLSRLPSAGREVAMSLRSSRDTRHVPIVFADGDPAKVKALKSFIPDATFTTWDRMQTALPAAIATPLAAPVVPVYPSKPAGEKLGIKPKMRVCLIAAPKDFARTLSPVPAGATFTLKASADCGLFLVFVRSRRELAPRLDSLARYVTNQPVWLVWPKKASGLETDVDGNVVRLTGLAAGWVDYKVCSVDETWSGLAFKKRR